MPKPLLAQIGHAEPHLPRHLFPDRVRDADPARLCEAFKPGSHVDAIAEDVAALQEDVAEIGADAEGEPAVVGCVGFQPGDCDRRFFLIGPRLGAQPDG